MTASTEIPATPDRSGPHRRCIVHIGANKTGSTTIQGWLGDNVDALAKQGIRYDRFEDKPLPALVHAIGFTALGMDMCGKTMPNPDARIRHKIETIEDQNFRVEEFSARAEASIARTDYHTYVISSEYLPAWLMRAGGASMFHEWLAQRFDSVGYVYYVRDQIDWLPSAYTQMIKMGGTVTFEAFLEKNGERNFCRTATQWKKAVGEDTALSVRLLERDFLKDGDLIADFADVIGADPTGCRPPRNLNEAIGAKAVEKMRQLNVKAEENGGIWNFVQRGSAIEELIRLDRGDKLRLTPEQALEIARRNEAGNERLRKRFLPQRKGLFTKAHALLTAAAEDAKEN